MSFTNSREGPWLYVHSCIAFRDGGAPIAKISIARFAGRWTNQFLGDNS
jgi:hypothetical protein